MRAQAEACGGTRIHANSRDHAARRIGHEDSPVVFDTTRDLQVPLGWRVEGTRLEYGQPQPQRRAPFLLCDAGWV